MNDEQLEKNIEETKKKSSFDKVLTCIILLGFLALIGFGFYKVLKFVGVINSFGFDSYVSLNKMDEKELTEYLENMYEDKYNKEFEFKLRDKSLKVFCKVPIDGCLHEDYNDSVYVYLFNGSDEDGNEFLLEYTDSYKHTLGNVKEEIKDTYNFYLDKEKYEEELAKNYSKYYVYLHLDNDLAKGVGFSILQHTVVFVYDDTFNVKEIDSLYNSLKSISSHFAFYFTNDKATYDYLVSQTNNKNISVTWEYNKQGYDSIVYNDKSTSNNVKPFTTLSLSDSFYYVLFKGEHKSHDFTYELYRKAKN